MRKYAKDYSDAVEAYWNSLLKSGKKFIDRDSRSKDENLIPALKAAVGLQAIKESIYIY